MCVPKELNLNFVRNPCVEILRLSSSDSLRTTVLGWPQFGLGLSESAAGLKPENQSTHKISPVQEIRHLGVVTKPKRIAE